MTELTADNRPALDDARRAITHALACGPRLGWVAVEGTDGEAVTITYSRGNGSAAQSITARFRMLGVFYRFTDGDVALTAGAEADAVRVWGHVMNALYSPPAKAHRTPCRAARRSRRA